MNDLKTTVPGAIAALAQLLKLAGLDIPHEALDAVTAIAVAVLGYFAQTKGRADAGQGA